jgi:hypothetical protein
MPETPPPAASDHPIFRGNEEDRLPHETTLIAAIAAAFASALLPGPRASRIART